MRIKAAAAHTAIALACLLTAFSTHADPPQGTPPPFNFQMAGVGSRSVQDIMNIIARDPATNAGLVATVPKLFDWYNAYGSQDYDGSNFIVTRDPNNVNYPDCGHIHRPRFSIMAVELLSNTLRDNDGCIGFAVTAIVFGDGSTGPMATASLDYRYWLRDAFTYAVRSGSPIFGNLSPLELKSIYNCELPTTQYKPLLPPYGDEIRTQFLKMLGLADAIDFVSQAAHACVAEVAGGQMAAHSWGLQLTEPQHILPYSAANYIAQIGRQAPDRHGRAVLGSIAGIPSVVANTNVPLTYVVRDNSQFVLDLSTAELRSIYNCGLSTTLFLPLLPRHGSALRQAFLSKLGFTDSSSFAQSRPCITEISAENKGVLLTDPRHIAPHSTSSYVAQLTGQAADARGRAVMGWLDGLAPMRANASAATNPTGSYAIYVVIQADPQFGQTFGYQYNELIRYPPYGPALCAAPARAVIERHGFVVDARCGDSFAVIRP